MRIYAVSTKFIDGLYSTGVQKNSKTKKVTQNLTIGSVNPLTFDMVNNSLPEEPGDKVKVFHKKADAEAYAEKLRYDNGKMHNAGGFAVIEAIVDARLIILVAQKEEKYELYRQNHVLKYSELPRRDLNLNNLVQVSVTLPMPGAPIVSLELKPSSYITYQAIFDENANSELWGQVRETIYYYLKTNPISSLGHLNTAKAQKMYDEIGKLKDISPATLHSIIFKESQVDPSMMDSKFAAMTQVLLDNLNSPGMYAVPAHVARSASTMFAQKQVVAAAAVAEEKHAVRGPKPPSTPYPG